MALNFSNKPYFDDFEQEKSFYKILFKPGIPVQTRELNQLQTIINKQAESLNKHVFKEGSMVIPGNSSVDINVNYVKLQSTQTGSLIGKTLKGQTSGVTGLVVYESSETTTDPYTIFVKYTSSGSDTLQKVFESNEILLDEELDQVAQVTLSEPTGIGSIASIESGFYFIKNFIVQVQSQTIVLDKYDNKPTYKIGLNAVESIITADEDESLLDNAQGSPNFSAPGADRYKIDLILEKRTLTEVTNDDGFIQLILVENGQVKQKISNSDYAQLEATFARRTFDESGDYTVRNFPIDVREYRNNYRGQWLANTIYLSDDIVINAGKFYRARKDGTSNSTAPTHNVGSSTTATTGVVWTLETNPFFNRGIHEVSLSETLNEQNANKNKLSIGLEPGKAYVKGYEIEKISTEYVTVDKAVVSKEANNLKIPATVGHHVIVTNMHGLPDTSALQIVDIYNRYTTTPGTPSGVKIGSAIVRQVEFNNDTPQGLSTTKYKLSIFRLSIDSGYSFELDAKQFYINGGSTLNSFTADISPIYVQLSGSLVSNSNNVTGFGTLFLTQLKVGDYIYAGGHPRRRVTTITSNTSLEVDTSYSVTPLDGDIYYREQTSVIEPENLLLVYKSPYDYVKSMRDINGVNDISYTVSSYFTQTSVSTGASTSTITLTVAGTDTFASPSDVDNYLISDTTNAQVVVPTSIVYGATNQQVIITLPTGTSKNYKVIAAVNKSGAGTEKTKTLSTHTVTLTTKNAVTSSFIGLGKSDGFRLLSVKMDTGNFTTPTGIYDIDITDRYNFLDGQAHSAYYNAAITLKAGSNSPTAPITIVFEYFEHSGSGDYFSVNSYLSTISYSEIPRYKDLFLSDCLDFRPRASDNNVLTFTTPASLPKRGIDIQADLQYYVSRIDKIVLNQDGSFYAINGTPDLNPKEPSDNSTGMVLYKLNYLPFTQSTSSVEIESIDNKRYTMRDIGKIEKRVDSIEYYTSLSMLEQQTQSLEIQDEFGLNRFKNGFVVDNFSGHSTGNVTSPDYKCSVDMENGELRPMFYMDNVNMIESNKTDSSRLADGYQVTGDLITLPYTETELVKQTDASKTENINPFAIFTFIGSTELNPASDEWFEVNRLPDIVTNVDGNFNSVYAAAERSGVLSTVWNAWQTQWTGSSVSNGIKTLSSRNVSRQVLNTTFGDRGIIGGQLRNVVAEVTATEVGQSRTGIRTVVVPNVTREVTEDKVLSKAVIPYIRARGLLFVVRGLKPNTTFTPFFDSVKVGEFVTPATIITINKNELLSDSVRAGGDSSEFARTINNNTESALDRGDVIYVKQRGATLYTKETSPATGVLSLKSHDLTTTDLSLVNIKGTFQVGDIIQGSITNESSTIVSVEATKTIGSSLVSNKYGDVVGIFNIPNTESLRFRTGTREFKLSDDINDLPTRTSYARKQYKAEGILETKQASVIATRNGEIREEVVNENRTIIQESARVISDTGWYDPLAQTFLVDSEGGAFATSVDIWFASKDPTIPVRLDIREVVNGYPGRTILPFSQVVKPADEVNISTVMTTTSDGDILPAPTVATRFVFPSPVYLNDKTEYCIVLMSDSNKYNCWISQLGQKSVVTGNVISEQPYAGVFFKSQNASTWTADQTQDLMFRINKAQFTTDQYGEIEFVNANIPNKNLIQNPFYVVSGTNYIRVNHENHCMFAGSKVIISGATAFAGIPISEINTTHTIVSVDSDSYIIQVTTNATFTGNFGGNSVVATEYIQYSTVQPIVQQQLFNDTVVYHDFAGTTGKSVNGTEVPYQQLQYLPVSVNDNNRLDVVNLVANTQAETEFMASNKSVKLRSRILTKNPNVSPVIDIARLSLITIQDRINLPTESNTNNVNLDNRNIVTSNNTISIINGNTLTSSDANTRLAFLTTSVGKYITTSGFASGANNGKFLITEVGTDGSYIKLNASLTNTASGASVTINILDRFVDEIAPTGSSSVAKYVTKVINLENPSNYIKVRFAVDVEENANIDVYYKAGISVDSMTYTKASPNKNIVKSNNGIFVDVEYNIETSSPFTQFQVKLVSTSTKSSDIVRVKDFVVVACA